MPEEIIANVAELLATVRANKVTHREQFLRALDGYHARLIEEFERRLTDLRKGRAVEVAIRLPEPADHTADYDREIRMLEMHQGDTIPIGMHLFDQLVMDNWGWKQQFTATNAQYS